MARFKAFMALGRLRVSEATLSWTSMMSSLLAAAGPEADMLLRSLDQDQQFCRHRKDCMTFMTFI
jgi:hypothetical protein